MAIVWADGFQHYGTSPNGGRDAMLSGAWAAFAHNIVSETPRISTAQARTGTRSLDLSHPGGAINGPFARRVLGASKLVVGVAQGIYFGNLPGTNGDFGFEWRTAGNNSIAFIAVQSDGAIGFYLGSGRTLFASSDPVITAMSWQHIEARLVIDNIVGSIEIRVNGIPVMHITDINTGTNGATQMVWGMPKNNVAGLAVPLYLDDVVVWDDAGSYANNFLGSVRVETLMPNGDTAEADWSKNGAADGWDCINETTPDGDTTYIMAEDAGDMSEFEVANSPPETANIKGVYVPVMGKLGDAGTGDIKISLVSGSDVAEGSEITLTTAYTYWGNSFMVDPATGLPWSKSAFDAMKVRVEKTL